MSDRTTICRDAVIGIKVLPGTRVVAFGCRDGVIGTWNPQDGTIETRAHLGVVRWFHPSDAAAAVDWDRFAVIGVKRVRSRTPIKRPSMAASEDSR